MNVARGVSLLLVLPLLLASCMQQQPDVAAVRKTVDEFNAASIAAMSSGGDLDKVMSYYEENAVSMPPNTETLKGREAIKNWISQMMQSGMKISDVKFTTMELDASGKVAYELGDYSMAISMMPLGDIHDHGKYMTIWRQQADGSWKVHSETWNTSMPLPSMDNMVGKKDEPKKPGKKMGKQM